MTRKSVYMKEAYELGKYAFSRVNYTRKIIIQKTDKDLMSRK